MNQKIVVFSGAGISTESGISTFRDTDGLWEKYDVMEVATLKAWNKDKQKVLNFYNERHQQVLNAIPNEAHQIIAQLEQNYEVTVITQNIDDLHERAGSTDVLHLHGEINKAVSSVDATLIYPIGKEGLKIDDRCAKGYQLRPYIVWFGEEVPNIPVAADIISKADILIIIGTSLNVHPAADLVYQTSNKCKIFAIDPKDIPTTNLKNLTIIKKGATEGMKTILKELKGIK